MNIAFTPVRTTIGLITRTFADGEKILHELAAVNGGAMRQNNKAIYMSDCTICVIPISNPMQFIGYKLDQVFVQNGLDVPSIVLPYLLESEFPAEERIIRLEE